MRTLTLLLTILALPAAAQTPDLTALAKTTLNAVQAKSQTANVEYCGYIGILNDALVATPARRGRLDSCKPKRPPRKMEVIASYHTHAGYDTEVDSEVPSVDDMFADEAEGIDGFVATPGGRLWYIDSRKMIAKQICGIGCLHKDTGFKPKDYGQVKKRYTIDELIDREDEG